MFNDNRKFTLILMLLLVLFALTFFIALADLNKNEALFGIGIPAFFENWLIMLLSIASIARIIVELYKDNSKE